MPQLEYFLAAQSIAIDRESDSVSIFHVLNDVPISFFPGSLPQLSVVSAWISTGTEISEKAESQIRLAFQLPEDEESYEFRGNLTSETKYQNYNLSFIDVPVNGPGELVLTIYLNDEKKASHTITIRQDDAQELQS